MDWADLAKGQEVLDRRGPADDGQQVELATVGPQQLKVPRVFCWKG